MSYEVTRERDGTYSVRMVVSGRSWTIDKDASTVDEKTGDFTIVLKGTQVSRTSSTSHGDAIDRGIKGDGRISAAGKASEHAGVDVPGIKGGEKSSLGGKLELGVGGHRNWTDDNATSSTRSSTTSPQQSFIFKNIGIRDNIQKTLREDGVVVIHN